jgi:glucose-6-phosphate 1-epimerase
MDIQTLNNKFAIADQLEFVQGAGGLILAKISNAQAEALVSTYAGQVLNFKPTGMDDDLLFMSEQAYFEDGKAIKGGIPVCWPWFGPDPKGLGRPSHGFVRNRQWSVMGTHALDGGTTQIILGLDADEETHSVWPNAFELRVEITIGTRLRVALKTTNKGGESFDLTQALHTYFLVGDIGRVQVLGLDGRRYFDKVDGGKEKVQTGVLMVESEVDRIYQEISGDLAIDDAQLERRIQISSEGSNTAVVWNPWADIATNMADLGDKDYRRMLCVETANAGDDVVTVAPGETYTLSVGYGLHPY